MTIIHATPSINPSADDPADLVARFVEAFNSGSAEALDALYEDVSMVVPRPGHPARDAARMAASRHLLDFGVPIAAEVRQLYAVDGIALLIVDWSIHGVGPVGREVNFAGAAADVARRGPDGWWRYLIDNPFGTTRL